MGVVTSREAEVHADHRHIKYIEHAMRLEKQRSMEIMKLLILGTAECGKSTILKQMKILHTNGFSSQEVAFLKSVIHTNIVTSMNAMLQAMQANSISFYAAEREVFYVDAARVFSAIREAKEMQIPLNPILSTSLRKLWEDAGVQEIFACGCQYNLLDSTKYFFENLDRISDVYYVPTDQDILRSRVATTGITVTEFQMKDITLKIFDVGGQRSERRKWIHVFDDVHAIIFISSLSDYNVLLAEDGKTNRMQESLMLFESICNSQYFAKTATILFLNKVDIFAEKLTYAPLTVSFSEYKGTQSLDECVSFVQEKFMKIKTSPDKHIYTHRTCATDTQSVKVVLNACFDIILSNTMQKNGLF